MSDVSKRDTFALFSTPLVVFYVDGMEEVNAALASLLLAEQQAKPSLRRSNVGGWHSAPDLAERTEPPFRRLVSEIVAHTSQVVAMLAASKGRPLHAYDFMLTAWAMIMRDGDYTALHDHGEAHWSTIYYVDAGDAEDELSGLVAFVDPRHCGRAIPFFDSCSSEFTLRPRTGALAVFPAWLQHYVHAYRGKRPRISVSCNLQVVPEP